MWDFIADTRSNMSIYLQCISVYYYSNPLGKKKKKKENANETYNLIIYMQIYLAVWKQRYFPQTPTIVPGKNKCSNKCLLDE